MSYKELWNNKLFASDSLRCKGITKQAYGCQSLFQVISYVLEVYEHPPPISISQPSWAAKPPKPTLYARKIT